MDDEDRTTNPNRTVVTVIGPPPERGGADGSDACLIVIYGDDIGRRVPLGTSRAIIGRSSQADMQVDQESVSRNHCQITFRGKRHRVRDLGSTNGTYVNDEPCEEIELRDGDQIKVGRTILKYITGGNVEAQYHEEIYRLMTVDGLTQIHNKRYFDEMLEREVSRCARYGRSFSLILFDIDHFKRVNDTHGHLAGDAVLRRLGTLVRTRVRRDDVVARTGGEEFAIILPEVGLEGAVGLARKMNALIDDSRFEFENTVMDITISLGVATWQEGMTTGEELIKLADDKLYEAKDSGRNRVCY
ncbi:MAG: GGDEF domain-containing protein [Deltaproteobacteria bacterium]|nr:GGDEF domain-containing protein [Deltaproteobacteria bacterium]